MANLKKQTLLLDLHQKQHKNISIHRKPVIYARVSSDKQAREATIERQLSLTQEIYGKHFSSSEAPLIETYTDEGYNLESKETHRQFWLMIERIKSGEITDIIVASEDRIFRGESAKLRGEITDIFRMHSITLISSTNKTHYNRDETSARLVGTINQELGAINKLETVKTLHHGRRRKLEELKQWCLSITPFGLRRLSKKIDGKKSYEYVIQKDEAQTIVDIYRLYVGEQPKRLKTPLIRGPIGTTQIAQILDNNQISRKDWLEDNPSGTDLWDKQKVLRILKNETYTGNLRVTFAPTQKVSGFSTTITTQVIPVPPIVPEDLFDRAQTILQKRRDKLIDDRDLRRKDSNWLHGIVRCPQCEMPLIGRAVASGLRYYSCPQSTAKTPHGLHRADDLESMVEGQILEYFLNHINYEKLKEHLTKQSSLKREDSHQIKAQINDLSVSLEKAQMRLEKLTLGWADGRIDDTTYQALRSKIQKEMLATKEEQGRLTKLLSTQGSIEDTLHRLDNIQTLLMDSMKNPERKLELIKLTATVFLLSVNLLKRPKIDLKLCNDVQIKALYRDGLITPKEILKLEGWTRKKIYKDLGRCGRKNPLEYSIELKWKS